MLRRSTSLTELCKQRTLIDRGIYPSRPFDLNLVITTHKRSLGQGNVFFTPVCHSVHGGGRSASCLGGLHPGGGVCIRGNGGGWADPLTEQCRIRSISGRYASYWNAFILSFLFGSNVSCSLPVVLRYDSPARRR